MKKAVFISLVLLVLIGCAMAKHREYVRNGMLIAGLNREAFLKEWGMPDRTSTISSDEFSQLSVGWSSVSGSGSGGSTSSSSGRAGFFKGKVPLDVWVYEQRGVTLVFNGLRLVGWKTEKTRKELESPQK